MKKVEYDLYKSPPRKVGGKEVTRLHARVANAKTVSIADMEEAVQKSTSLTKTDLKAVMHEVGERFREELAKGNRVHVEGIGYFQMTLSSPPDIKDKNDARAESIHFKTVAYTPEKDLRRKLSSTKFVRSERGDHTVVRSEIELMGILTDYFKDHEYITRFDLEDVCGMTRSTASRRIKAWVEEKKLKKILRIDAYSPVPGNFGVSREVTDMQADTLK